MHVEFYERVWMWLAGALIVVFLGVIVATAASGAIAPPSHMETVDPVNLSTHPEFGSPVVKTNADGSVVVSVVASMFSFTPDPIEVPADTPITFRLTSGDVIHGFEVVGTNANAMAIPGYVSQFTVTFKKSGDYVIACNEYCGVMHHIMVGKLTVKPVAR
jgi:cytochrome c oxidase subunit II